MTDSIMARHKAIISLLGPELFRLLIAHQGLSDDFILLHISIGVVKQSRDLQLSRNALYLLNPRLCFFIV